MWLSIFGGTTNHLTSIISKSLATTNFSIKSLTLFMWVMYEARPQPFPSRNTYWSTIPFSSTCAGPCWNSSMDIVLDLFLLFFFFLLPLASCSPCFSSIVFFCSTDFRQTNHILYWLMEAIQMLKLSILENPSHLFQPNHEATETPAHTYSTACFVHTSGSHYV